MIISSDINRNNVIRILELAVIRIAVLSDCADHTGLLPILSPHGRQLIANLPQAFQHGLQRLLVHLEVDLPGGADRIERTGPLCLYLYLYEGHWDL